MGAVPIRRRGRTTSPAVLLRRGASRLLRGVPPSAGTTAGGPGADANPQPQRRVVGAFAPPPSAAEPEAPGGGSKPMGDARPNAPGCRAEGSARRPGVPGAGPERRVERTLRRPPEPSGAVGGRLPAAEVVSRAEVGPAGEVSGRPLEEHGGPHGDDAETRNQPSGSRSSRPSSAPRARCDAALDCPREEGARWLPALVFWTPPAEFPLPDAVVVAVTASPSNSLGPDTNIEPWLVRGRGVLEPGTPALEEADGVAALLLWEAAATRPL